MAFGDAVAEIRAMDDKLEAFRAATALMQAQLDFRSQVTALRADIAREIREQGELSIGKLAGQLGVSKGRAQRLLMRAEQGGEGE
jgi:DNA-binding MarR family transcriptional regulator